MGRVRPQAGADLHANTSRQSPRLFAVSTQRDRVACATNPPTLGSSSAPEPALDSPGRGPASPSSSSSSSSWRYRCAWLSCDATTRFRNRAVLVGGRGLAKYSPADPRWQHASLRELWKAECEPTIHDGVYCHKHTTEISKIRQRLQLQGLLPPSRSSSLSSVSSTSGTTLTTLALTSSWTAASTSASTTSQHTLLRARRELDFSGADFANERTVGVELDDRWEEERQPDSERGDWSRDSGVPPPAGAQPREGEENIAPSSPASTSTVAAAVRHSFAVPAARGVQRTASIPPAHSSQALSPLALRSASVGGLPRGLLDVQAPSAPTPPPSPSFKLLVHIVPGKVRPPWASRSLSGPRAIEAVEAGLRRRRKVSEEGVKAWQSGRDEYKDTRAPWLFETVLQLMAMTTCSRWNGYHPGDTIGSPANCPGHMVTDGVKSVVSPVFECGAHCPSCGRRVILHNFASDYVRIFDPPSAQSILSPGSDQASGSTSRSPERPSSSAGGDAAETGQQRGRYAIRPSTPQHNHVQEYIYPRVQPVGITKGGSYHATVLKQAALYLLCGMRAKHLERLGEWSDSLQTVTQSTLNRYLNLIKHYVKMIYDDDHNAQLDRLRGMVVERMEEARASNKTEEELEMAGLALVFSADGQWGTRGWSARGFRYTVMDHTRTVRPNGTRGKLPPVCFMKCTMTDRTIPEHNARRRCKRGRRPPTGSSSTSAPTSASTSSSSSSWTGHSVQPLDDAPSTDDEVAATEDSAWDGGEETGADEEYEYRQVRVNGYSNHGNWQQRKGSAGMEGEAVREFVTYMVEQGIMKHVQLFITDGDSKIAPLMKEECPHVFHVRDPGHMYTKLRKMYDELCGKGSYFRALPDRMYVWLRRCHYTARLVTAGERDEVKRSAIMFKVMQCLMVQMVYHYHNLCDPKDCPHLPQNQLVDWYDGMDADRVEAEIDRWHEKDVPVDNNNKRRKNNDAEVQEITQTFLISSQPPSSPPSQSQPSSLPQLNFSQPSSSIAESQLDSDRDASQSQSWASPAPSQVDESASEASDGRQLRRRRRQTTHFDASEHSLLDLPEEEAIKLAVAYSLSEAERASTATLEAGAAIDPTGVRPRAGGTVRGRGRSRGGARGAARGGVRATCATSQQPRGRPPKRKAKRSSCSDDDSEWSDGEAPRRGASGKMWKRDEKGLNGHLKLIKQSKSGERCLERVSMELRRRQAACDLAAESGQQRPYGTTAAMDDVPHDWRMWLDLSRRDSNGRVFSEKFTGAVVASIYDEKMRLICHGFGTTYNESFNSACSRQTPKDVVMAWLWECRSQICVLNHNCGVGWWKRLFEMMGLPWTERDQRCVDKSEQYMQQREERNRKTKEGRRKRKRYKERSEVMFQTGTGDDWILQRKQREQEQERGTAVDDEAEPRPEVGSGHGSVVMPEDGLYTEPDLGSQVGPDLGPRTDALACDARSGKEEKELSQLIAPRRVLLPLVLGYKSAAEKRRLVVEPIESDSDKENIDPRVVLQQYAAGQAKAGGDKPRRAMAPPASKRGRPARTPR